MVWTGARTMRCLAECLVASAVMLCIAGCVNTEEHFTINGDGSGKVRLRVEFEPAGMMSDEPYDKMLPMEAAGILTRAKGVAAWKDVSFKWSDNGLILFEGTAYFPDATKFAIPDVQFVNLSWKFLHDGTSRLVVDDFLAGMKPELTKPGEMSGAEMKAEIARQRAGYPENRRMLLSVGRRGRLALSFDLPGEVMSLANLEPGGEEGVDARLELTTQDLVDALDALVKSDAWMEKQVRAGYDLSENVPGEDDELRAKLLGAPGPATALVEASPRDDPVFPYLKEVAEAQAGYREMVVALGLAPWLPEPADEGKVQAHYEGAQFTVENQALAWLYSIVPPARAHVSLSLVLPGEVAAVKDVVITAAVTDSGEDILPAAEQDRHMAQWFINREHTQAYCSFALNVPTKKTYGLARLAGKVTYTTAKDPHNVNLGFDSFEVGSKGKALGAEVTMAGPAERWTGWTGDEVVIRVDVPQDRIMSATVAGVDGKMVFALVRLHPVVNEADKATFVHILTGDWQEDGRIILRVYDTVEQHEAPFELTNVTWQGQPLE